MSHLGENLRDYSCGPGCHDFADTGLRFDGVVGVADDGESIPSPQTSVVLCASCSKDGRDGVCGFCDELCSHYDEVTGPAVEGSILVAVCEECHFDLFHQDDTLGWALVAIAPNPPHDP